MSSVCNPSEVTWPGRLENDELGSTAVVSGTGAFNHSENELLRSISWGKVKRGS